MAAAARHERMRAAVLGSPIAHSLSPALHQAAYAALGLDWTYEAIEVGTADLPAFIGGLDEHWAGLSLTMPLKEAVIAVLDDVDARAALLRSVNTVLPARDCLSDRAAGAWMGTNTDVDGIVRALNGVGITAPKTATIIGAGATARSAAAALVEMGVRDIGVCARCPEAADDVIARIAEFAAVHGHTVRAHAHDIVPVDDRISVDVVVSTLPDEAGAPWTSVCARAPGALLDVAYHPWPTPLAAAWPDPARVASGRDMLLWQAARQVELMTGLPAPIEAMRAALPA